MKWKELENTNTLSTYVKYAPRFTYILYQSRMGENYEDVDYKVTIEQEGNALASSEWRSIPTTATQEDIEKLADLFIRQFFITNFP